MRIVICASVDFTPKIKKVADSLTKQGHQVELPYYTKKILSGEVSLEQYLKVKQKKGDTEFRKKSNENLIMRYFNLIKDSDAILVLNFDKKGIKNYIGGNTFLEMGFAHVLGKKIFLYKGIPKMAYTDELKDMNPQILNGNLSKIQ